ncbi:hypothetical protein LINPERHAP2_LOCUS3905 [Linum perenne]
MTMAWELGIRKLAIQIDSIVAIRILQDRSRRDYQHANLARRFRSWSAEIGRFLYLMSIGRATFFPTALQLWLTVNPLVLI